VNGAGVKIYKALTTKGKGAKNSQWRGCVGEEFKESGSKLRKGPGEEKVYVKQGQNYSSCVSRKLDERNETIVHERARAGKGKAYIN